MTLKKLITFRDTQIKKLLRLTKTQLAERVLDKIVEANKLQGELHDCRSSRGKLLSKLETESQRLRDSLKAESDLRDEIIGLQNTLEVLNKEHSKKLLNLTEAEDELLSMRSVRERLEKAGKALIEICGHSDYSGE